MSFSGIRLLGYSLGVSGSAAIMLNITGRFFDSVEGTDPFSLHTASQHQMHIFSGMHEPFIPTLEQQKYFHEHFAKYEHLLPTSLEDLKKQRALETSVKIRSLSNCNCSFKPLLQNAGVVVVGGPPALLSSAHLKNVIYIRHPQGSSILDGSAFHLEWDAESEAPTTYLPTHFMAHQVFRLLRYESLYSAEKTGQFSWRTLDWASWIKHPKQWSEGIRIAMAFQRRNKISVEDRTARLNEVSLRCSANQQFYEKLNQDLGGQLLLPARGSIIVARTEEEELSLLAMNIRLKKEGKALRFLWKSEMRLRYGFVPRGIAFAEKRHDAVLAPHFMHLIAERIEKLGGKVIEGVLTKIYVNNPEEGGIIQVETAKGMRKYICFSHLVLSLGNQRLLDQDDKPLFDVISARGVSVLALVRAPKGQQLPAVLVCGGTNHVTKLSEAVPITVQGKQYDGFLVRMTAAACITPTISEEESANYDGVVATGLVSAVRQTLGCPIDIFSVYGCNRQVSEHGESHWIVPAIGGESRSTFSIMPRGHSLDCGAYRPSYTKGIVVQMGAGGGGLTQAPAQAPLKA